MSDKMHVLFVMEDLCFGGTQRQMVELACRLDRTRFRVSMLSSPAGRTLMHRSNRPVSAWHIWGTAAR